MKSPFWLFKSPFSTTNSGGWEPIGALLVLFWITMFPISHGEPELQSESPQTWEPVVAQRTVIPSGNLT